MSNNLYRTLRGNATNRVLGTIPCSLVDLHGAGFFKVLYLRFWNKVLIISEFFFFLISLIISKFWVYISKKNTSLAWKLLGLCIIWYGRGGIGIAWTHWRLSVMIMNILLNMVVIISSICCKLVIVLAYPYTMFDGSLFLKFLLCIYMIMFICCVHQVCIVHCATFMIFINVLGRTLAYSRERWTSYCQLEEMRHEPWWFYSTQLYESGISIDNQQLGINILFYLPVWS